MKTLLLICLTALISGSGNKEMHKELKTYYYFCNSHSMNRQQVVGKEYILYTKVKKIECEQEYFRKLTNEWGNRANADCKNSLGCTSDLNSYETFEAADNEFKKIEKRYSDTSKYIVKVLDF